MEENKKEIFTRKEIEHDLHAAHKKNIIAGFLILFFIPIFYLIITIAISLEDIEYDFDYFLFYLCYGTLILGAIGTVTLIIYNIYKLYSPLKYQIATDNYEYFHIMKVAPCGISYRAMNFKTYGDFPLELASAYTLNEYNRGFYTWSEISHCGQKELYQGSFRGDEFYLIIIKNKIRYIYNKRYFEFKETN